MLVKKIEEGLRTNYPREFDVVENMSTEDGVLYFDFETDFSVSTSIPDLEEMINSIASSDDAEVLVPGSEFLPEKDWTGYIELEADTSDMKEVIANWKNNEISSRDILDKNLGAWEIDYQYAVDNKTVRFEIYRSYEYSFTYDDVFEEFKEIMSSDTINDNLKSISFNLNSARSLIGECYTKSDLIDGTTNDAINRTVHSLMLQMGLQDRLSSVEVDNQIIFQNSRKRRQVEGPDGSPRKIVFAFSGDENSRLIPSTLEKEAKLISENFDIIDTDTIVIRPAMYQSIEEEVESDENVSTSAPITAATTIVPTLTNVTEGSTINVTEDSSTSETKKVDDDDDVSDDDDDVTEVPTPTVTHDGEIIISGIDEDTTPSELEDKIISAVKIPGLDLENIECEIKDILADEKAGKCLIRTVLSEEEFGDPSPETVESKLEAVLVESADLPGLVDSVMIGIINECGTVLDDCHEFSECSFEESNGITCTCLEDYDDVSESEDKMVGRLCVPKGLDAGIIVLIVLIIILFIVILILSYLVHQKRTRTGMYSPNKVSSQRRVTP